MAVRVVPELNAKGEIVVLTGHLEVIEQKKNNVKFAFRLSVFFPLQPVAHFGVVMICGVAALFTGVKAETTETRFLDWKRPQEHHPWGRFRLLTGGKRCVHSLGV
jgi:hypothetical protein